MNHWQHFGAWKVDFIDKDWLKDIIKKRKIISANTLKNTLKTGFYLFLILEQRLLLVELIL
ncbi:hypothetical protein LEQ03_04685 [Riemerella anatipestifer]|nr:hypothetical protein LEQ03_04685 [Riemerella anatipestifer]